MFFLFHTVFFPLVYGVKYRSERCKTSFFNCGLSGFRLRAVGLPTAGSSVANCKTKKRNRDMARWTGLTAADKRKELTSKPLPEVNVTQEMRQTAFDNWETTDDHGMVIYGIAKDQNGKEYFMVKNSWGLSGKYKGIWYASKAFVAYKTMNILVHKDALPKDIAKKLGIK